MSVVPSPVAPTTVTKTTISEKFIRGREVILHAVSMCPDKNAKIFLDDEDITDYCQPANELIITDNTKSPLFKQGDGIYNTTTGGFAKVMDTSNNIIYTDENYLNVRVTKYNNIYSLPSFKIGDIVYQARPADTGYTLVAPYPNPNPAPLYRNPQENYGWSTWMKAHAVWSGASSASSHSYTFPNVTLEAGTYTITYAIDDYGTVTISGGSPLTQSFTSVSFSASQNQQTWTGSGLTGTFTIPANLGGDYKISWSCGNNGGPGGISVVITKGGGTWFDSATAYTTQLTKEYYINQSFQGRIANIRTVDTSNLILAIKPELGTFNTDTSDAYSALRKLTSSTQNYIPDAVTDVVSLGANPLIYGDLFAVGSTITNQTNSTTATIAEYYHRSGVNRTTTSVGSSYTPSAKYDYLDNDYMTISGGSGLLQKKLITGTTISSGITSLTLGAGSITGLTSNSKYSLGDHVVDEYGSMSAIFNIPESLENKFKAGPKVITVVDGAASSPSTNSYIMKASSTYNVAVPPDVQQGPTRALPVQQFATPVDPPPRRDPVAQTFFVPGALNTNTGENSTPYGMFCPSVEVWFSAKPENRHSQLPVVCRIVDVELGTPTEKIVAETYVQWKDVKTPSTNTFDPTLSTKFTFKDPVFLLSGKEYAIVIISDSPEYYVMICDLGGYILGAVPPRRASRQPNLGSFFKSQNGSTWTPMQTQDMVFRINQCVFNSGTTGTARFAPVNQTYDILADAMSITTTETNYKPTSTNYWIKTRKIDNTFDAYENFLPVNTLYDFGGDLKVSTKENKRRRWLPGGDLESMNVGIQLSTSDPNVSPIVSKDKLKITTYTSIINDGCLSNNDVTISSGGSYQNVSNINITVSSPDYKEGVKANAFVYALTTPVNGIANVNIIKVDNEGSGYWSTPQMRITETFETGTIKSNTTTTMTDTTKTWTLNQWQNYKVEIISDAISAGSFVAGQWYIIDYLGTTDFTQLGAPTNCIGVLFQATSTGNAATDGGKAKIYSLKTISSSTTSGQLTISGTFDTGMPAIYTGASTVGKYTYRIIGAEQATATFAGETSANGGNAEVRYITKRVDLADGFDAGDLRVYLDCIRPQGTHINVYYKVKSALDNDEFNTKKWQLMNKASDQYSPDQSTMIQLEYLPKFDTSDNRSIVYYQDGKTYPTGGKFKQFAIKITMTAMDPTVTPVVINFSAIACPAG